MNHDPASGLDGPEIGSKEPFGTGSAEVRGSGGGPDGLRPNRLVVALATLYGLGAFVVAGAGIVSDVDGVVAGLVLWGTMWLALSAPCAGAIAVVGWRTERALRTPRRVARAGLVDRGAPLRRAWAWLVFAAGVMTAVHWLAMTPWALALVGAAILDPHDAEEYLPLAAFALVAWLLAAGGVILSVGGRRLLALADGSAAGGAPDRAAAVPPSLLPTSAVVGLVYALSVTLPTGLWFVWLEGAWHRGAGGAGLLGWVLLGVSAATLAGGIAGTWLVAAAPVAPWTSAGAGLRQMEVSGAILTAHWVPTFLLVLSAGRIENTDQRYVLLLVSFVMITLGTAIWSAGRTWRVRGSADGVTVSA